jgi:hypothetical protein
VIGGKDEIIIADQLITLYYSLPLRYGRRLGGPGCLRYRGSVTNRAQINDLGFSKAVTSTSSQSQIFGALTASSAVN